MSPRRRQSPRPLPAIGWREWLALPELGIERIKVKVDTGARTSALHAFDLHPFEVDGKPWIRCKVHPVQRNAHTTIEISAPVVDERRVRPSTGKAAWRPVIRTRAVLGGESWPIDVTLVNRDVMGFRMLLARRAIRRRFLVDPGRSFLAGEPQVAVAAPDAAAALEQS